MGHFSKAKKLLNSIALPTIPRSELLRASNLSRRCGLIQKSLKILGPLILKQIHRDQPATASEKADYAFSLNKIGLYSEAQNLLTPLCASHHAEALFFRSLTAFTRWDYQSAYGDLQKFVGSPQVPEYRKMVGLSNLVSACIFLKNWQQAQLYLDEVTRYAEGSDRLLLKNLCVEQQAEIYINTEQYQKAERLLDEAALLAKDSGALLNFWIDKWAAVLLAKQTKGEAGRAALLGVFQRAQQAGHWEICRDIDFQSVAVYFDQALYNKVFFGTPFQSFKDRLQELSEYQCPEIYSFILGQQQESSFLIDLVQFAMRFKNKECNIKLTETDWRVLASLASDFYRPIKVGELFGHIIKDEYYDPFTSPNRIHQAIYRLNQKLEDANIPMKIQGGLFGYYLQSDQSIQIKVSHEVKGLDQSLQKLLYLKDHLQGSESFKAKQASQLLEMSERSAHRWLRQMVESQHLIKTGQGKNTRYLINLSQLAS